MADSFNRREVADLRYTLASLRAQYSQATNDEDRARIEKLGKQARHELEKAKAAIRPTVSEIDETHGEGMAADLLALMILRLRDYLNIGKNITADQTQDTARLLVAEYSHLTMEHFAIVFQRAKLGQWGQVYDRLDGVVIAGWLQRYTEELRQAVADRQENQHLALKVTRVGSGEVHRIRDIMTAITRENITES